MRVCIVWVKGKKVTLKNPPSKESSGNVAGMSYPQNTRKIDSPTWLFSFQSCASHMPFSWEPFSRVFLFVFYLLWMFLPFIYIYIYIYIYINLYLFFISKIQKHIKSRKFKKFDRHYCVLSQACFALYLYTNGFVHLRT